MIGERTDHLPTGEHGTPDAPSGPVQASDGAQQTRAWEATAVRRLRGYLGETQAEFAERLGTRQQTVSEWETGSSRPRRMAQRLLGMVAEERGFYSASALPPEGASPEAAPPEGAPPDTGA